MFKALKDVNTGIVYKWTNTETEEYVYIPKDQWRVESEWSSEQVAALFGSVNDQITDAVTVESSNFLAEVPGEVEQPELPLDVVFTHDFSKDD